MLLTGNHVLNAPISKVWSMLMDPVTLARIVPAVSSLELTGENEYKALAEIKMGPVSGAFSGNLSLLNIRENEGYSLHVKQSSKIGNADALINIALKPAENDQTELTFEGDARLSGLLARTGQRIISGVATTLTKQFFANFDEALK